MDNLNDLISRAAVFKAIVDYVKDNFSLDDSFQNLLNIADSIAEAIHDLPAVDAAPVVHGKWMDILDKPDWDQKMCSVCGDYFCCQNNYCPNCGAKMDSEQRIKNDKIM